MITASIMKKAIMIDDNIGIIDTYLGKKIEFFKVRDENNNLFDITEYHLNHSDDIEDSDDENIHIEVNLSWMYEGLKMSQSLHLQEHHLDELIEMIVYAYRSLLNECEMKLNRVVNSVNSIVKLVQKVGE